LVTRLASPFSRCRKYERGTNRIAASRLLEMARVLDVPITFFYDDTDPAPTPAMPRFSELMREANPGDHLQRDETVELVAAYYQIPDPKVRRRLRDLVKAMAEAGKDNLKGATSGDPANWTEEGAGADPDKLPART
jgi:transcriptional regulator with XRE-family HTH domain